MRIAGHGLALDVPDGWDARIFRRPGAAPVLHLATFALAAHDGDFGGAATGRMRPDDAFASLVGYRTEAGVRAGAGLFAEPSRPGCLAARDFRAEQLQVTRPGHLGCQRFFSEAGRALCLYAVIWPVRVRAERHAAALSAVLATLAVHPEGAPR